MAKEEAYPQWLLATKRYVSDSKDWKSFAKELQGSVEHQLNDNHVFSFEDLTQDEKLVLVEKAARAVQAGDKNCPVNEAIKKRISCLNFRFPATQLSNYLQKADCDLYMTLYNVLGSSYKKLYSKVSLTLDQQINNSVAGQLLTGDTSLESTKTELILDYMREGAVSILRRWPDMKVKLRVCVNMPIPQQLQSVAWTLFLSDPQARKRYLYKLMNQPSKAISKIDHSISQMCEEILKIQNTFLEIGPPCVGSFFAMKAVLSYFHAQQVSNTDLHHVYYLLILPMLQVLSKYISRTQPAGNNIVAVLVEMYLAFIATLPKYVVDIDDEYVQERREFTSKVAQHLITYDQEHGTNLTVHIASMIAVSGEDGENSSLDPDTSTMLQAILTDGLFKVVSSLIKSLFVGFLNKSLLMFVWDQYIIGLDVPGYHMQFLPAFTASLFILLRNDLLLCKDEAEMISVVQKGCCRVNVNQIQQLIKDGYLKALHNELKQNDKAAIAIIDPTAVVEKPWIHWNNEIVPDRLGVEPRRAARDARIAERKRLLKLQKQDEIFVRSGQHFPPNYPSGARIEELLKSEQQQRMLQAQSYEMELDKMKREILSLKKQLKRPNSSSSYYSAVAPPPSRVSLIPSVSSKPPKIDSVEEEQNYSSDRDPSAQQIVIDLLSAVAKKYNSVSHGEGDDYELLNGATRKDLDLHKRDVEEIEKEVFGKELDAGQFENMDAKANKYDEVVSAIRKRLEQRREKELEQSQI